MPSSVLDAIRAGIWDFEPSECANNGFDATEALPGTDEKLEVMARRVRAGHMREHVPELYIKPTSQFVRLSS